jgi:hypothetical protein
MPASKPLRFVAFQVVASTPNGEPVYSVADIIEPTPKYRAKLLRSIRKTAGPRGYVMVGRAGMEWPDFKASARHIGGTY